MTRKIRLYFDKSRFLERNRHRKSNGKVYTFMKQEKAYKIKLVKILEILCQDSDEENYITTCAILKRLDDMNIICDRRTLYTDIGVLNDFGYKEKAFGKNKERIRKDM